MEEMIFFKEFNVVKILERGAFKYWEQITIGTEVGLELEKPDKKIILAKIKGNKKDEGASKTIDGGGGKLPEKENSAGNDSELSGNVLGELPEKESEIIRNFLKLNWEGVFEAYVCKMDEKALYDQRISIAVYIKKHQ